MIHSLRSKGARRSSVLLALLLSVVLAWAQAPGYQGKKFHAGYTFCLAPALRNPNQNGNAAFPAGGEFNPDVDKFILSFNPMHMGEVDYVIGRLTSVSATFSYFKTKAYGGGVGFSDHSQYTIDTYEPSGLFDVKGMGFGFGFKFFASKYIAPFGRYFKLEFNHQNLTTSFKDVKFYKNGDKNNPFTLNKDAWYVPMNALGFSIGKQRIVKGKLLFDFGMRMNIPLTSGGADFRSKGNYIDADHYMTALTLNRAYGINFLALYLGVNFLAF